ncbi:unnamed protein product [Brassicogethes aeneus]|uniref:Uncharacterized protein n=1 Tax=Brassicogethes aeneus TaxID=1431903 RepID=A0A9P0FJ88_BRAAE|nr:unnamed protein product [Brassicogethes aeneus]
MRHLKSTLKRSLTPTGAEMKAQSSLEVPQPIRSASFDDNQLEARRNKELVGPSAEAEVFLRVPPPTPTAGFSSRSQSIDISMPDDSSSSSEAPSRRFLRRISSSCKSQYCWHCKADKEHQRLHPPEPELELEDIPDEFLYYRDSSESESDDEEYFKMFKTPTVFLSQEITEPAPSISIYDPPPISITTTIEVHSPTNVSVSSSNFLSVPSTSTDPRFLPPQNEQSSSSHDNPLNLPSFSVTGEDIPNTSHYSRARRKSIIRQESFFVDPNTGSVESDCASEGAVSDNEDVRDYFLKVPDLRRDRARSVDSSFSQPNKAKTEELTHSGLFLEVPTTSTNASSRSRSIDIVLPTHEKERYKALLLTVPQDGKVEIDFRLVIRNTSDWSETAKNGDHVWAKTTESTEACQVGEHDCTVSYLLNLY